MVWINSKTTMYAHYEKMLVERGGGTLADDGFEAFNVITTRDMAAFTESIVSYAKWLARSEARVNELEVYMGEIAMHQQPLGLELSAQVDFFQQPCIPFSHGPSARVQ